MIHDGKNLVLLHWSPPEIFSPSWGRLSSDHNIERRWDAAVKRPFGNLEGFEGRFSGGPGSPVTIGFDTKSWSNDLDKFGAHDLGNLHMTINMFHFMNYSRGASNGLDMFGP